MSADLDPEILAIIRGGPPEKGDAPVATGALAGLSGHRTSDDRQLDAATTPAQAATAPADAATAPAQVVVALFDDERSTVPQAADVTVTWGDLVAQLGRPHDADTACDTASCPGKACPHKLGSGWSPARYAPGATRSNAGVLELTALVLDLDDVAPDRLDAICSALVARGCLAIVHGTHSDRPGAGPRFVRIVVAISRPVPAVEWPRFWAAAVAHLELGDDVDPRAADSSRLYFWPRCPKDLAGAFLAKPIEGAPLDVDAVLANAPADLELPIVNVGDSDVPAHEDEPAWLQSIPQADRVAKMRAHLEHETGERKGESPRGMTWNVARSVARGYGVADLAVVVEAMRELYNPKCDPQWSNAKLVRFVECARRAESPDWGAALRQWNPAERLGFDPAMAAPTPRAAVVPVLTDAGNAEVFAQEHRDDLRWVPEWGSWVRWDGACWRKVPAEEIIPLAIATARGFYARAKDATLDREKASALAAHATKSESANRLEAMIRLARGLLVEHADSFDQDPYAFNVQNGTLDLRATGGGGGFRQHRREDLLTKIAPVTFDPAATCPRWDTFLARVLPDPEVRAFVQRFAGYTMTGDVGEQVMAFFHGRGSNGKSTFLETLQYVLGCYGRPGAPDLLIAKLGEAHPTEQADLQGARLVVCQETEAGRQWSERTVKSLTGGDKLKARFMHRDFFEFAPTHKLIVSANHKPKVRGQDHAIWRRILLVPWNTTIEDGEKDVALPAKLRAEASGILAWAVRGCELWQANRLMAPPAVREATAGYRADQDHLGHWVSDECELDEGSFTATTSLYRNYEEWCRAAGGRPWERETFREGLIERGLKDKRTNTARGIAGIRLKSPSSVVAAVRR